MAPYQDKIPKLAWSSSEDFFWTRNPYEGNYVTVVLTDPKILTSILVETGLDGRDFLESGQVELGHNVVTTSKEKSCKEFLSIGTLENGRLEVHEVDKRYNSSSSCVRIRVTAKQTNWLVIRNIRVKTKWVLAFFFQLNQESILVWCNEPFIKCDFFRPCWIIYKSLHLSGIKWPLLSAAPWLWVTIRLSPMVTLLHFLFNLHFISLHFIAFWIQPCIFAGILTFGVWHVCC